MELIMGLMGFIYFYFFGKKRGATLQNMMVGNG